MFSTRPAEPHHVHRQLQLRDRLHRAQNGRGPGHVTFHRLHRFTGFQRQATRIESDTFPHEGQPWRLTGRGTGVTQDHQPRRSLGTASDRQQGAAAFGCQSVGIPDFDFHGRILRDLCGRVRKGFRIDHLRRFVDESPSEIDGVTQDLPRGDRIGCCSPPAQCMRRQSFRFELIEAGSAATNHRSRHSTFGDIVGQMIVEGVDDRLTWFFGEHATGCGSCAKGDSAIPVGSFSAAGQSNHGRCHTGQAVQIDGSPYLGLEFLQLQQSLHHAPAGHIQCLGWTRQLVGKQADHDCVGGLTIDRFLRRNDLHSKTPLGGCVEWTVRLPPVFRDGGLPHCKFSRNIFPAEPV